MKTLIACMALSLSASAASAGGFLQNLPKDGSWVRYHVDAKMEQPQQLEMSGKYTFRSVGKEMVEGKPCRWIEVEITLEGRGFKQSIVYKMLVPEAVFKGDNSARRNFIRGWLKYNEMEPRRLEDLSESAAGLVDYFFPYPAQEFEERKESKTVDYQSGQLKIETASTAPIKLLQPENASVKWEDTSRLTTWAHEKVPFGTAAARMTSQGKSNGEIRAEGMMLLSLEDFGLGAKSALPDQN